MVILQIIKVDQIILVCRAYRESYKMSETLYVICKIILIGIGATAILDLWTILSNQLFKTPITNWAMVGRWIGYIPSGKWIYKNFGKTLPLSHELALVWLAHYLIGISYIAILVLYEGDIWLSQPTITSPLIISWFLLIAPFLIMMPGMGAGIAGSNTPNPKETRLMSIVGHTVFCLGIYISAVVLNILMS